MPSMPRPSFTAWPRFLRTTATLIALLLGVVATYLIWASHRTEAQIEQHHQRVLAASEAIASNAVSMDWPDGIQEVPAPVKRYLHFAFPNGPVSARAVQVEMAGEFRRPGQAQFAPTTARQTASTRSPGMMFDATTPILPGIHARAWDAYVGGQMEMKARILSVLTVVDESGSPTLNRISLRRWLLESPTYPQALLPGGAVRWEAVDEHRARAIVSGWETEASMLVHFADTGAITSMQAEEDGDLGTPYHGSGEHVTRGDYQTVNGVRIPMRFVISRAAHGQVYPFWDGRITRLQWVMASQ